MEHNYIVGENGLSSASRFYMKKTAMDNAMNNAEKSKPLVIQDENNEYTNLAKELGVDCIINNGKD